MRSRSRPQRLGQLEARIGGRCRGAPTPNVDLSHLTVAEREEMDRLACKLRRLATGRWDFSALDDAELERLRELVAQGQAGVPDKQVAAR